MKCYQTACNPFRALVEKPPIQSLYKDRVNQVTFLWGFEIVAEHFGHTLEETRIICLRKAFGRFTGLSDSCRLKM